MSQLSFMQLLIDILVKLLLLEMQVHMQMDFKTDDGKIDKKHII